MPSLISQNATLLALLWFRLGKGSLMFVLVHSVMWPLALNAYAGFRVVPQTLRMAGRNYRLGWYIFQSRNELFTDKVFAGLATVIVIGLLFEHIVFDAVERMTVRRWGMQG